MTTAKIQSKPHRRNLQLPPSSLQSLANLRQSTDAVTDAEVIRRALKLYEAIVGNQEKGAEFIVREDGIDKPLMVL